jgi:serine/threonine protein kinase
MIGKKIANYEILSELGSGGMGVVYKARDDKLRRIVAIKFLKEKLSANPHYLERFRREAYSASALNHPNICTIHDIGQHEDRPFLVMEYVEGESLDRLLAHGPLPIITLLHLAIQVADALHTAHARGLIHRDIKPSNMIVSPTGYAKILDFGLAKWVAPDEDDMTPGRPVRTRLTAPQQVLGTPPYMAPEQIRGHPANTRSDLFSFGCVVYQMATGESPFQASTVPLIYESILNHDPPMPSRLNKEIPPKLDRIIKKALVKSPHHRYQSAAEFKSDLVTVERELNSASSFPQVHGKWSRRTILAAALILLIIATSGYLFRHGFTDKGNTTRGATFSRITTQSGLEFFPSLSPDGDFILYAGRFTGNWDVYLQRIGGQNATNLTADSLDDDTQPVFSSDGNFIAFRSERDGGGLMVMGATGESPRRVSTFGYNPSWSPSGTHLVFSTENVADNPYDRVGSSTLWIVDVASGNTTELTGTKTGVQPSWSPHGQRIAYSAFSGIWTIRSDGTDPLVVIDDGAVNWSAQWSHDGRYLYYSSDRGGNSNLWRVSIDEQSGKVIAVPEALTTGGGQSLRGHASVSRDGRRIAYVEEAVVSDRIQKVPFDPIQGKVTGTPRWLTQDTRAARHPEPSPDGKWLAYMTWGQQEDIIVTRPDGSGQKQITNDPSRKRVPRWSPDGRKISFYSNRSGNYELWSIRPDGSGLEQLTHYGTSQVVRGIWSPDGGKIAAKFSMKNPFLIEIKGTTPTEKPLPSLPGADVIFDVWSWSGDGRWLAGTKNQVPSGAELGITIFDLETQQYTDLTNFGMLPVWLPDSRRLLFESHSAVYLIDRVSKKSEKILELQPHLINNLGQLPPDGRTLYYGLLIRESDVWLMTLQ